MTFKTYLQSKGVAKSTQEAHQKNLLHFVQWSEDENQEPETTTHNDLIAYIKHLQKRSVKQRTVQIYINSLHHYFMWLIAREIREDNPVRNINIKGIKRKQLYHILTKRELENIYEAFEIPNEETDENKNQNWFKASVLTSQRNKVILGLMIWQGLGTGELSKLETKHLKLRAGKIYIAGSRRSNEREMKLEATQILDLMEYTLQTRKALLKQTGKATEQLIISTGQGSGINNLMTKLVQQLQKINPNVSSVKQIRTSVITHWLKHYNLREVQYMAGHRYVSSTESYLINDLEGLSEDVSKYHPIQ